MNNESSLGLKIALGVMLLAALLLATVVVLALLRNTGTSETGPSTQDTITWQGGISTLPLADAAERANARVAAWADDAVLVRISGSWRPGPGWPNVEHPPLAWSFAYYSATEQKLVSVSVSEEEVFWGSPRLVSAPIPALRRFPPPYGPDTAWLVFRAAGGDRFLRQNPQALVGLRLTQEGDTLVWRVTASDADAYIEVWVNAETGVLISA